MVNNNYISKYIHIVFAHDAKFSNSLVKMIKENSTVFNWSDHHFVFAHEIPYKEFSDYDNMTLDTSNDNLYIKYAGKCMWIISHGCETTLHLLRTPIGVRRKIIYRYWGGSRTTGLSLDSKNPITNLYRLLKIKLFRRYVGSFAAIGVANVVDILDMSRIMEYERYYILPYVDREMISLVVKYKNMKLENNRIPVILIGHRGSAENNHISIIEKLMPLVRSGKVSLLVPLSYGNKEYISQVKEYINRLQLSNIEILDKFLTLDEYLYLLRKIDIAIFDGSTSYALGNISFLLTFNKRIYLSKDGIIAKTFDKYNIHYFPIDKLHNLQYNLKENFFDNSKSVISFKDMNSSIALWIKLFEKFN